MATSSTLFPLWLRARSFMRCSRGATAIEYGLIALLVSVGIIGAAQVMSGAIVSLFEQVRDAVATVAGG